MGRYSVKRYKTKRRTKDLDLVYNDLASRESVHALKNQPLDETKPGLGQYYCVECAKYFENQEALDRHGKGKIHKRRLKDLRQRPYTPLESQASAGYNVQLFLDSVEKYKQIEAYKQEHKEELDAIKNEKKDTLDAIITGIPSEAKTEETSAEGKSTVNEVEMTD